MNDVFVDTAYAIALAVPKDAYHVRARAIALEIDRSPARLVTTTAVLLEIGDSLARSGYRSAAIKLIDSLGNDPQVLIVPRLRNSTAAPSTSTAPGQTRNGGSLTASPSWSCRT